MFIIRKLFNGLTLRCLGAVSLGLGTVTIIITALLVLTGNAEEAPAARMALYTIKFPEDEQTLKDLSAQILKEDSLAQAARDLQDVQPAAGSVLPEEE